MDGTEKFVVEQNVTLFLKHLQDETEPERRRLLQRLLIVEETRFGRLNEQLELVDRHIAALQDRILAQKSLIARLDGAGANADQAGQLLANLLDIHVSLVAHRDGLDKELNRI